jgi:hypothetical protein
VVVTKRTSFGIGALVLSLLPLGCAPEETGDDGTGGTGNVSGTTGAAGGNGGTAGSGGASGASTGGSAGSVAGSGGVTGGAGGTTGGSGGALAGSAGVGPAAGTGGNAGGGAGGTSGGGGAGAGGSETGGAGSGATAGSSAAGAGGAGAANGGTSGGGGSSSGASGASGKGGSAGSGGAGGSSGFDPCPATGPCKVLPLGDSITDGIGFSGGYRVHLFELAIQDQKEITFVGGSMNGPNMVSGQTFPRSHEGHSGWTIQQIDGITPDPALNPTPHIVLLHIGTNDMYGTPAGAPDRLGALIDQILTDLPNSLLVVSNIIPFPGQAGQVTTFNNAVPGVVMQRANQGKHILFVDQFMGFPTNELGDGVHPNQAGYSRMADKWYAAIKNYLK